MHRLGCDCDGFEIETLISVRALKHKLRVAEVPSFEAERINGVSNLRPIRDGFRILGTILRERRRRIHPLVAPLPVLPDLDLTVTEMLTVSEKIAP